MKSQIKKIDENDVKGYIKLVEFTKKIFDKGFTELSDIPFDRPAVMMKQLPSLLKLKSYKSVYSLVSSYIKNEKLRRMLSMHPLLVGGNPFTNRTAYRLMADGGRADLAGGGMPYEGGIMDLESSRQMYGLGKLVKKVTR